MSTRTTYYNLTKPDADEHVLRTVINQNYDAIDLQMHANAEAAKEAAENSADEYDETASYLKGDFCINQNTLYRANKNTSGPFTAADWDATTIADSFEPKHTWRLLDTITATGNQIVIDKDIPEGTTSILIRLYEKAGQTENAGHVYVAVRFEAAPTVSVTTAFFSNMITNADRYAIHDLVMDGNRVQALFSPPASSTTANANVNQRYAYNFFDQGQIIKILIIGHNSVPHNAGSTFEIYVRQ